MRRVFLGVAMSLSVPLLLFMNVWQSHKYMLSSFEIKGLIKSQSVLVLENKKLINDVANLESPSRISDLADTTLALKKIGGGEIIRIKVVEDDR